MVVVVAGLFDNLVIWSFLHMLKKKVLLLLLNNELLHVVSVIPHLVLIRLDLF